MPAAPTSKEEIQLRLEEETSRSRCLNEETNEWLARAEISTSSGMDLEIWETEKLRRRRLDEYPVIDGETLPVILVPAKSSREFRGWDCVWD